MLESFVTWAEVDLDAIAANVRAFQQHVGGQVEIIAVVKSNAYGHGAPAVAQAALQAGATRLAVHRLVEGIELRRAGITAPLLIMGYTPPEGAAQIAEWQLTPSVITLEFLQALSEQAGQRGWSAPVHIKVDTGMNRYGLLPEEVLPLLQSAAGLPHIQWEGMFTHFSTADWVNQTYVRQQLEAFQQVVTAARQAGFALPLAHAANSAAAMKLPEAHFNAVRIGISMYGMIPSDEWAPAFPLSPALTLKSRVTRLRWLPAGAGISYGRTHVTQAATRAALVPVGYGDGYHRAISNKGCVLVRGQRAPILGRVCMDQFVVDVTHIPDVQMHDEVVLVGRQGNECLSAEEVAIWAGTINYEVTTALQGRVPRVYLRGGKIESIIALGDA